MKPIFVIASINTDLACTVDKFPVAGQTVSAKSFNRYFGGKGANQAIAASRLGAKVFLYGKIGKDIYGEEHHKNFMQNNIDTIRLCVSETQPTGTAFIHIAQNGDNEIIIVNGANMDTTPEDMDQCADLIAEAGIVVSQFEVPVEATIRAFQLAKNSGGITILNPAPARPVPQELWRYTDIIAPNWGEMEMLCGAHFEHCDDIILAGKALLEEKHLDYILVTLGENGALVIGQDKAEHLPAHKVHAVDTTAAGDSFIGALSMRLAEYTKPDFGDVVDCAKFAGSVAAVTVQRQGAQSSLPTKAEVLQFMEKENK